MPHAPAIPRRPKTGGRQKGTPNKPTGMGKRPKTGGRQKGTPNKATVAMREALLQVFAGLQDRTGRENGHLFDWALGNSTDFYRLTSRLMPREVTGDDDGGPAITRIELVAPTAEDIERARGQWASSGRALAADDCGNEAGSRQTQPGPIQSERGAGDGRRALPAPASADPVIPGRGAPDVGGREQPFRPRRRPRYESIYRGEGGWMG